MSKYFWYTQDVSLIAQTKHLIFVMARLRLLRIKDTGPLKTWNHKRFSIETCIIQGFVFSCEMVNAMSSKSDACFKQSQGTVLSHVWYQTTVDVDVTCMFRRQIGIAVSAKPIWIGVTSEEFDFMMCLRSCSTIRIVINSYRMPWRRWRQRNKWL